MRSGSSTGISRIMIHTDGKVEFHGVWGHNWLSLYGITFTFGAAQQSLDLNNGWHNFNNGFQPLQYSCKDNLVTVSGRVSAGKWGSCIANLRPQCRPSQHLIFTVNNGHLRYLANAWTTGCIEWHSGGRDHGWLSLSGIAFTTGLKERVYLDRWRNHGHNWADASKYSCTRVWYRCLRRPHRTTRLERSAVQHARASFAYVGTSQTRVDSSSIRIRMNTCSAWTAPR